jgi:hypothetical protein
MLDWITRLLKMAEDLDRESGLLYANSQSGDLLTQDEIESLNFLRRRILSSHDSVAVSLLRWREKPSCSESRIWRP